MPEISGFSFPNDIHVHWSLMIVMYPYITGFVAGSFIVTSLYHVFGRQEFKPIAKLSLAASFCFLLIAGMPLQLHLGHPERGIFVMITPHFTSAMAGFGLLYTTYLVIVALEVWFVWRQDIIEAARRSRGLKRSAYKAMALWTYDSSPEAQEVDHKVITVLAGIGLPMACMLHGYVGFIFGAIKANPWWSTPLMPVIFLLSAAVSGIALLSVVYQVVSKLRRAPVEEPTVSALARWLWFFLILTITLELLEIIMLAYEKDESWHIISQLLTTRLEFSFITVQMIIGGMIPLILLGIVVMANKYMAPRLRNGLTVAASLLLLLQVFSMRWNVVIGGQLLSKSLRGLRSTYNPELFGREGVLMAIALFITPFVLMFLFDRLLPIHKAGEGAAAEGKAGTAHA
jgi:Ni/Fe-hydrogenase subunit HybB-like protein